MSVSLLTARQNDAIMGQIFVIHPQRTEFPKQPDKRLIKCKDLAVKMPPGFFVGFKKRHS